MRRLALVERGKVRPEAIRDDEIRFNTSEALAWQCWSALRAHHVYPEPGGFLEQDARLMADIAMLDRVYGDECDWLNEPMEYGDEQDDDAIEFGAFGRG